MRIPITRLKELSKQYDLSHVILFAYHPDSNEHHIATYGKTIEGCSQAADFGNQLKDALGWPQSLHQQPSRVKQLQKRIADLEAVITEVCRLSDVGNLFDGHDELNEYTIEENNKLMEAALDRIYAIATGKEQPE